MGHESGDGPGLLYTRHLKAKGTEEIQMDKISTWRLASQQVDTLFHGLLDYSLDLSKRGVCNARLELGNGLNCI